MYTCIDLIIKMLEYLKYTKEYWWPFCKMLFDRWDIIKIFVRRRNLQLKILHFIEFYYEKCMETRTSVGTWITSFRLHMCTFLRDWLFYAYIFNIFTKVLDPSLTYCWLVQWWYSNIVTNQFCLWHKWLPINDWSGWTAILWGIDNFVFKHC